MLAADVRRLLERIGVPRFRYRELRARERWEAAAGARGMPLTRTGTPRAGGVVPDFARIPPDADSADGPVAIAIASTATGVGKTTISANLASAIARAGWRCWACDLDPRRELAFHFGFEPQRVSGGGPGTSPPRPVRLPGGVYVPFGRARGGDRVAWDCDVLVVDTPAPPSPEVGMAIAGAHEILVPLRPDDAAYETVIATEAFLARCCAGGRGRTVVTYLVNAYDARLPGHREIWAALRGHLGPDIFPFPIQWDEAVREARASRRPIERLAPESQVVADMASLAEWLLARHQRRLAPSAPTRETFR